MRKLHFERTKYGRELLIDACDETDLDMAADIMVTDFYTIIFLEQGRGTYHLDAEPIPFADNMVVFVKPGQINKVNEALFGRCVLLFFERDFLDEFFNDKDFILKFAYFHNTELPAYLPLATGQFLSYYKLAQELHEEIRQPTIDGEHILRSIIYYLLIRLNQAYAEVYGTVRQSLEHPTVLKFLRLLERDIREQKGVATFAEELGISRVQLNKLCQEYFSKTAHQIIRERTLAEVKKTLKYSTQSISEIAYDFNFSAPSHFSRFVKQMTGMSPQDFKG